MTTIAQGNNTPGLNAANGWFEQRIDRGTQKGNLTTQESSLLNSEMSHYESDLANAQSDGTVSKQERKQLWQEASSINHSIYDLRHNDLGTMGPGGADGHCPHMHRHIHKELHQPQPPVALPLAQVA